MRLLNSWTGEIKHFPDQSKIPTYAIVSHTWNDEEITLLDWQTLSPAQLERMEGYAKLRYCCAQAAGEGIEWIWIDTYDLDHPFRLKSCSPAVLQMLYRQGE
jgi:hypothetical protein